MIGKPTTRRKLTLNYVIIAVVITLLSAFLGLFIGQATIFRVMERKTIDMRFGIRGPLQLENPEIVIVTIDEQASNSLPARWPWPRDYYARVIHNLNRAGARAIGIDVILDKPDYTNPQGDQQLATVLSETDNVVLAGKVISEQKSGDDAGYHTLVEPLPLFLEASGNPWGSVLVASDEDGFWRRYLLTNYAPHLDEAFYGFAIEVLRQYHGYDTYRSPTQTATQFQFGDLQIPLVEPNYMQINFQGPRNTFPYYSFDTVIDDSTFLTVGEDEDFQINSFDHPPEPEFDIEGGLLQTGVFKDKIVLIGAVMEELHDNFPTPFTDEMQQMPGVEIHANALHTIMTRDFIRDQPYWLEIIMILVMVAITYLLTSYLRPISGLFLLIVLMLVFFSVTTYAFIKANYLVVWIAPTLAIGFCYTSSVVYHFLIEQREKRLIKGAFKHYLNEKVVEQLIQHPEMLKLGGEERHLTVLFSDIEGFTTISEKLNPTQLVNLINEYLTEMSDIVVANDGIIDKYVGDAITAEFGAPILFPDHAYKACCAALQMQARSVELRQQWRAQGRPELLTRIGINTGTMIIGNMGSRNVFNYTVLGDHANLGARLEGANKYYGTYTMISEFTYAEAKDKIVARTLDLLRVKGKTEPIQVFELVALKSDPLPAEKVRLLEQFEAGIVAYREQKWDTAIAIFAEILESDPKDKPSEVYLKRCQAYRETPPPDDWDGVYTLKTK